MSRARSLLVTALGLCALALPAAASAHGQLAHSDPMRQFHRFAGGHGLRASAAQALALPGLARAWCGVESTVQGLVQAVAGAPDLRLVYAHPADVPDQFASYSALMQGDAAALATAMAAASGGTKSLRWDLGSACGPQYADIASVRLPQPAAYYEIPDSTQRMQRFERDLLAAIGPSLGRRDYVVYADGLPSAAAGSADLVLDDRPGPENANNSGGRVAVLWGEGGSDFLGGVGDDERRAAVLHEIGHLLGGVQLSAPHSTGAGHCTDGWDVMCYADGGPRDGQSYPCPGSSGHASFDCNHDDYFSPSPAPSSYLATHWNAYDSLFLCPISDCAPPQAPPAATFHAPKPPVAGRRTVFDASASQGAGGIVDYRWDLNGDGTYETDTGGLARVGRTYRTTRRVTVGLLVRDAAGSLAVSTRAVRVKRAPRRRVRHAGRATRRR
ncbi:MAG: Conserved putative secreted protein [Solirubrobacterales bacterium]|nr:Conserved putative secreted protein [Solirubrobacterales bacterium]